MTDASPPQLVSQAADQIISSLIKLRTPSAHGFLKRQSAMRPDSAHPLVLTLATVGIALLLLQETLQAYPDRLPTLAHRAAFSAVYSQARQLKRTVDRLVDLVHSHNVVDPKEAKHAERAKQILTGAVSAASILLDACGPLLQAVGQRDPLALSGAVRKQVKQDKMVLDQGDLEKLLRCIQQPRRTLARGVRALLPVMGKAHGKTHAVGQKASVRDVRQARDPSTPPRLPPSAGSSKSDTFPSTRTEAAAAPASAAKSDLASEDGTFDWTMDILGAYQETCSPAVATQTPQTSRTIQRMPSRACSVSAVGSGTRNRHHEATVACDGMIPSPLTRSRSGSLLSVLARAERQQERRVQAQAQAEAQVQGPMAPGLTTIMDDSKETLAMHDATDLDLTQTIRQKQVDPVARLLQFPSSKKQVPRPGPLKTSRSMPLPRTESGVAATTCPPPLPRYRCHQEQYEAPQRPRTAGQQRQRAAQNTDMAIRDLYY